MMSQNKVGTKPLLHTHKLLPQTTFNRLYMAVYALALLSLFHYHAQTLIFNNSPSFILSLLLFISDLILAFLWCTTQSFHFRPIRRREFPENLENIILKEGKELPAVDIFICTADPYKEPPIATVNTALSVMAYDYPPEKLSIYVSDDGGSQVTLFALMEGVKFGRHWLPFCRENNVVDRCPQAYFDHTFYDDFSLQAYKLKILVSCMKDKDVSGEMMPNLVYTSREKNITHHHRFKAGALNALVRISATMTNAPIILILDCDMYSNDPQTIKRVLCYFFDLEIQPTMAYVQFPQFFHGLNKGDIYFGEQKRVFQINPLGMDGLSCTVNMGTGSFFQRRALFGNPSSCFGTELLELGPKHVVKKPIGSQEILELAHSVAACDYENNTRWGTQVGYRYGSLVEDYYTSYRMHCEGWKSVFCNPERPAFLGDSPITLINMLSQTKRWMIGLLNVLFLRYSPITFGIHKMGILSAFTYTHFALTPIYCIPLTIYAFVPQLALLRGISTFPQISDLRFYLYIFLFIGANGKDLLDFLLQKGTFEIWWNSQRIWMICGLSSYLFGFIEYILSSLGIVVPGFDVTSKVQDDELKKRYEQSIFEFGVVSPMFVPMTMASIINLVSFATGLVTILRRGLKEMQGLSLQILLSGFVVINCWPLYKAMVFRRDNGRMPTKITLISTFLASFLCLLVASGM
ncbi:cellulose synthase-like protein G3 isoform X2 [Amaranthus tricolor]|uniref:cellulose synthase-like protein G3 isoform X2 n=1 Tax=Amaranthus tricolor TaxID=29722 RepID=UPI002590E53E|nr:cellulose synthase-like protein G3 isoform X2 [Amaranthus tricolor]